MKYQSTGEVRPPMKGEYYLTHGYGATERDDGSTRLVQRAKLDHCTHSLIMEPVPEELCQS